MAAEPGEVAGGLIREAQLRADVDGYRGSEKEIMDGGGGGR